MRINMPCAVLFGLHGFQDNIRAVFTANGTSRPLAPSDLMDRDYPVTADYHTTCRQSPIIEKQVPDMGIKLSLHTLLVVERHL